MMKSFGVALALILGFGFGHSSFGATGLSFICAGLLVTGISLVRSFGPDPLRSRISIPLNAWVLAAIGVSLVGAFVGHLSVRAEREARVQAEEAKRAADAALRLKREAEAHALLSSIPAFETRASEVEANLSAKRLVLVRSEVTALELETRPLRVAGVSQSSEAQALIARLEAAHASLRQEEEAVALGLARTSLEGHAPNAERLLGLAQARTALGALETSSDAAAKAKGDLEKARLAIVSLTGALRQKSAVVSELLLGRSSPVGHDDALRISGFSEGTAFAIVAHDACQALYLSRPPGTTAGLTETTISNFLTMALGPSAKNVVLKPPPGTGARQWVGSIAGSPVHAGWMDGTLVEVWVGDFTP